MVSDFLRGEFVIHGNNLKRNKSKLLNKSALGKKKYFYTLFEIFIFCPKNSTLISQTVLGENSWKCWEFGLFACWQLWFHEKNCRFFGVKNSWKCYDFVLFSCWSVDNFDFTRKIVNKCFVKMINMNSAASLSLCSVSRNEIQILKI